jgi:hypothetical protein
MSPSRESDEASKPADELQNVPQNTKIAAGVLDNVTEEDQQETAMRELIPESVDEQKVQNAKALVPPSIHEPSSSEAVLVADTPVGSSEGKDAEIEPPAVGMAVSDPMESSTATLMPTPSNIHNKIAEAEHGSQHETYVDPTPHTPMPSAPPSRSTSTAASIPHVERSPTRSDAGFDDRHSASEDEPEADSRSEIQSIMEQFSEEGGGPGVEEVMSPRLEFAGPLLGSPIQHPPRKSSLTGPARSTPAPQSHSANSVCRLRERTRSASKARVHTQSFPVPRRTLHKYGISLKCNLTITS